MSGSEIDISSKQSDQAWHPYIHCTAYRLLIAQIGNRNHQEIKNGDDRTGTDNLLRASESWFHSKAFYTVFYVIKRVTGNASKYNFYRLAGSKSGRG